MSSKYEKDKDLEFLHYAKPEMLTILSKYVLPDTDKNVTNKWHTIAGELQRCGGNSIANFFRRSGVLYHEILLDVCEELKVDTDKTKEAVEIEQDMLVKLFDCAWDDISEADKNALKKEIGSSADLQGTDALNDITQKIKMGGKASYIVSGIAANSMAQSLLGVGLGGAMVLPFLGLLGPIGMLFSAFLGIKRLSGPNYEITIPAVIQIAAMRQQMLNSEESIF